MTLRLPGTAAVLALAGALWVAPAAPALPGPEPDRAEVERASEETLPVPPGSALAAILEGTKAPGEVEGFALLTECVTDEGWSTLRLFGDGVGFYDRRVQVTLSGDELRGLMESFRAAGFAGMPPYFGEGSEEEPGDPEELREDRPEEGRGTAGDEGGASAGGRQGRALPARLICRVRLAAGGDAKEVRPFDRGERSQELRSLAEEVLGLARDHVAEGVTVESLADGLEKVASGALDPRALTVTLHRRFGEDGAPGQAGWMLRLHDRQAEIREFTASGGPGATELHALPAEGLEEVLSALVENEVWGLPVNLWARSYTDLSVTVLGWDQHVQARQFAGMTLSTHGESQTRFSQVFNVLHRLYLVLDESGGADG